MSSPLITSLFSLLILAAVAAPAQEFPAALVKYSLARDLEIRASVSLTGTVKPSTRSVIASEVDGLVLEMAVREGDRVVAGAPLARLRRTTIELQLESVRGQLREAEARVAQAERRLTRAKDLYKDQVATLQQLDDTNTDFESWRGREQSLKAEASRLRDRLERTTIRAPFPGVVTARHTELGEWIAPGAPVVDLVSTETVEIEVDVPENWFSGIGAGSTATIHIAALGNLEIEGRVRAIVPVADARARTFKAYLMVQNPQGRIGAGMVATVAIAHGQPEKVLAVPKDAIVARGPRNLVMAINPGDVVGEVQVQTGGSAGAWIAVTGDLQPGAKVIVRGNERIFPGSKVRGEILEYAVP